MSTKQFHGLKNRTPNNTPTDLNSLSFKPSGPRFNDTATNSTIQPTFSTDTTSPQILDKFHDTLETEMKSAMEETTKRMEQIMDQFIQQNYAHKSPPIQNHSPSFSPPQPEYNTPTPTRSASNEPTSYLATNSSSNGYRPQAQPSYLNPPQYDQPTPIISPHKPTQAPRSPFPPAASSYLTQPTSPQPSPLPSQSTTPSFNDEHSKRIQLLEKELEAAYQREQKLNATLESIEKRLAQPSKPTETKESEKPAESPDPTESKFSALSAELNQVVQSLNSIATEPQVQTKQTQANKDQQDDTLSENSDKDKKPNEKENKSIKAKDDDQKKSDEKASSKGSKKLIYIITGVVLLIISLGAAAYFFFGQTTSSVDEDLLKEYLPEDAIVETSTNTPTNESADTTTEAEAEQPDNQTTDEATPAVQGASTSRSSQEGKYEQSFADISYGETRWETHKNPQIGVSFDYPINSSNVVRTDSSVTVLRKTGYIFKIQAVETGLDLEEYWKNVKARSLRYKVQEIEFRDVPALQLVLEDITDYPGDRILVKKDDRIYDIWYATPSKNLDDDDSKRVEIMLNSFKFLD